MSNDVLVLPDQQLVEKIWKEFGLNKQRIAEAIKLLKDWLEQQPHLPKENDDRRLEKWLLRCKNSIEKTKQLIDLYFTLRTVSPEILTNWDITGDWWDKTFRAGYCYAARELTSDGDRVTFVGLNTSDATDYEPLEFAKMCLMLLEIRTCEDYWRSDIVVWDFKNISMGHITKLTLPFMKKFEVLVLRGYKFRVKSVHWLNLPPYAEVLASMIKSILKPKIAARIQVHGSDHTELYKYIPRRILPTIYGGDGGTIEENVARWRKKAATYKEWYLQQEKMKSDESKRPGKALDSSELFGIEGSFRKLDLD